MDSFLNFFNQPKLSKENEDFNYHLILIGGLLLETAAIDGNIDDLINEHTILFSKFTLFGY